VRRTWKPQRQLLWLCRDVASFLPFVRLFTIYSTVQRIQSCDVSLSLTTLTLTITHTKHTISGGLKQRTASKMKFETIYRSVQYRRTDSIFDSLESLTLFWKDEHLLYDVRVRNAYGTCTERERNVHGTHLCLFLLVPPYLELLATSTVPILYVCRSFFRPLDGVV
jgi:hypothetical protein